MKKSVLIIKGEHANKKALIIRSKKEDIGNGKLYELTDINGAKLWNGQYSFFPESFLNITNQTLKNKHK